MRDDGDRQQPGELGVRGGEEAQVAAAVTTVGYLGSFTGPPAIGALAELTSVSAALVVGVGAGAAIALLAGASLDRR